MPKKSVYSGLFFISLAALMLEILLTRIFSVTMYFHFAFVAISIVMFGLTVGSLLVYLRPDLFAPGKAGSSIGAWAFCFAAAILLGFAAYLRIPFHPTLSLSHLGNLTLIYAVLAVPFIFCGVAFALVFTRHAGHFGGLYAADLIGAAAGAACLVPLLNMFDAVSAVFLIAAAAFFSASLFGSGESRKIGCFLAAAGFLLSLSAGLWNAASFQHGEPIFRIAWVKGKLEEKPLYEKWNHFSRITVVGDLGQGRAFNYGPSPLAYAAKNDQKWLFIDSGAGTPIVRFDGDIERIGYLKYDVVNLVHALRPQSRVLVVGAGGGRDLLSALAFGQPSITGLEINGTILRTVNGPFGEFSGHLDKNPKIKLIGREARSFIAQSKDRFDIIQLSFVDTNSATAAGAFIFSEHSLYTVEAWKTFLGRLSPRGVLSVSRWYDVDGAAEIYRMAVLAGAALEKMGVRDARRHVLVVKNKQPFGVMSSTVGNILVSREPFTDGDLDRLEEFCRNMDFDILQSPRASKDGVLDLIFSDKRNVLLQEFPLNLSAPTDDNPFFFFMLRLGDLFSLNAANTKLFSVNVQGLATLGGLLVVVLVLCALCILLPLLLQKKGALDSRSRVFVCYAALLGIGFMLIELSQMQRLMLYLGDPVYGLTVVLFTLLFSSGLGSLFTHKLKTTDWKSSILWRLGLLLGTLTLFGLVTAPLLQATRGAENTVRIPLCLFILLASGTFMGMALPLGIRAAAAEDRVSLLAWLWGVNGAASVLASVLSMLVSLYLGISATYWLGAASYGGAFLCVLRLYEKKR